MKSTIADVKSTAYELPMDNSGESMQRHFSIFFGGGSSIKFRVVNEECPICPSETTQFGDSDRGTSNWLVGIYRDFLADSFWKDMNQWSIPYLLAMAGKSVQHFSAELWEQSHVWLPSGKLLHNYGQSPCYQWVSPLWTITIFNNFLYVYQRVRQQYLMMPVDIPLNHINPPCSMNDPMFFLAISEFWVVAQGNTLESWLC